MVRFARADLIARIRIEARDAPLQRIAERRVLIHYPWIVTRDNVSRALGKTPELVPAFDHVRHVVDRREGRRGIHVLVKVQRVGGKDHGARR